jgi:hypothetical protein
MFAELLESAKRITVDLKKWEAAIRDRADDLVDHSLRRLAQAKTAKHNPTKIAQQAKKLLGDHPDLRKLAKGDASVATKVMLALNKASTQDSSIWDDAWKLSRELMSWETSASTETPEEIRRAYAEAIGEAIKGTRVNAETVSRAIQGAIKRARYWKPSLQVTVQTSVPWRQEDVRIEPSESFYVVLGRQRAGFTVFVDGKQLMVDDVLEAGDPDFFADPLEQASYFDLVSEIRRPGSTKRSGKNLVLYTARPVKDRTRYEQARTVPTNIFLTTDPDRAIGISMDLGGGRARDVWRVVINSQHLVRTLSAGRVQDFQAVGTKPVPVKSIDLVSEGAS